LEIAVKRPLAAIAIAIAIIDCDFDFDFEDRRRRLFFSYPHRGDQFMLGTAFGNGDDLRERSDAPAACWWTVSNPGWMAAADP
ncbi:MAG: hypothetical protein ACOYOU_05705, partial [Kiritimatiellia bacterium]